MENIQIYSGEMKVQVVLVLLVAAVEMAHCKRSFSLWDILKPSAREPEYDREVKPDEV